MLIQRRFTVAPPSATLAQQETFGLDLHIVYAGYLSENTSM